MQRSIRGTTSFMSAATDVQVLSSAPASQSPRFSSQHLPVAKSSVPRPLGRSSQDRQSSRLGAPQQHAPHLPPGQRRRRTEKRASWSPTTPRTTPRATWLSRRLKRGHMVPRKFPHPPTHSWTSDRPARPSDKSNHASASSGARKRLGAADYSSCGSRLGPRSVWMRRASMRRSCPPATSLPTSTPEPTPTPIPSFGSWCGAPTARTAPGSAASSRCAIQTRSWTSS